jgi:hypothetical protein
MDVGLSPARNAGSKQARSQHRHDLRTLSYVTLDQANGGIVRNLSHEGIGLQVVAAVRPRQQLRVRFELRYPKLRVEARGEVMWATFSGQCGIRFLDLSPRMTRQIDEWILGNLLEGISLHAEQSEEMFFRTPRTLPGPSLEADHLTVSTKPVRVIELPARSEAQPPARIASGDLYDAPIALDWLSQPLSGRGLAWTVNTLVVVAALLLFVLVFLSVTREAPRWPVATSAGMTVLVAGLYWGFFKFFGGASPGERLARLSGTPVEDEARDSRFR